MLTLVDTSLVVDTRSPNTLMCAFEYLVAFEVGAAPEVIMVGVCGLGEVYRLGVGKLNTEWLKLFGNGGSVLVRIIAVGDDRVEMNQWAQKYLQSLPKLPRCNLHGMAVAGRGRPIRCETTGENFASQSEACATYGIHQSLMSRHLAGRTATVSGMIFRYV